MSSYPTTKSSAKVDLDHIVMNHGCLYRAESAITSASRSAHLVRVRLWLGKGLGLG